jgi:hypothetical protein
MVLIVDTQRAGKVLRLQLVTTSRAPFGIARR